MDSSACYPPQQAGATSLQLLQRLRLDDTEAWRDFVLLYGPVVRYWIRRVGVPRHDHADVFQETFVAIHRKAAEFQPQAGAAKFRAWLKAIALSKIADYFRQRGRRPVPAGGTDALLRMQDVPAANGTDIREPPIDNDDAVPTREALRIVRDEFQDQTWQAFWRTAVDGCNASLVADELGMSAVAVRKAKSRVLCRLREFLALEEEPAAPLDDGASGA